MADKHVQKMMEFVAKCDDPAQLRTIAANAEEKGVIELTDAAKRRLFAVLPSEQPGTLEYEVWRSIFALEEALKEERGKTILLARTRQKIKKEGEHKCVEDLVMGKESEGFKMLKERDMLDLAFEAVALRFSEGFNDQVLAAAKERLIEAGYRDA